MMAEPAGVLSCHVYAVVYAVVTIRSEDDAGRTGAGRASEPGPPPQALRGGGNGRRSAGRLWFCSFLFSCCRRRLLRLPLPSRAVWAFSAAAAASAFSAAARWVVPTASADLSCVELASIPALAETEDCADELGAPVTEPHAEVASRTESMPAASRLFLRMENKASSWECGTGGAWGIILPGKVTVCGTRRRCHLGR